LEKDHEVNIDDMEKFTLQPIGYIRSSLRTLEDCPLQESEGAPEAVIEIDAALNQETLNTLRSLTQVIAARQIEL